MAAGPITALADVIVPEQFADYIRLQTETKSRLVQSGALARVPLLDGLMAGGGATFHVPSFNDLDDDAEQIADDTASNVFTGGSAAPNPAKITTNDEVAVRLSRAQAWSSANLAAVKAGADPMAAIGGRVANYWQRRLQDVFVATWQGVIADNLADENDFTNDISGGGFVDGVTNFSSEAYIDAKLTMGDSMDDMALVMVHSVVFARMMKNNLIDFIPDSRGEVEIPTFMGAEVIVDDGMPNATSIYETWLFGTGATVYGVGSPPNAIELSRQPEAGNFFGQDVLYSRVDWTVHPVGHAYTGASTNGGPANTVLDDAASWNRVYPERKQVKFARLVTREA
jgi:hypothetical protein